MVDFKVQGKETEFVVDLPKLVDKKTKKIIEKTLKKCVEPDKQDKAMQALNKVLSQTNAVIEEIKKQDKYHESLEKNVRKFVGIQLHKGFEIGIKAIQPHEVDIVREEIAKDMVYEGEVIEGLPEKIQKDAKFIFACLELTRITIEAGLTLGILISMEKADQFYKEEGKELSYIH